MQCAPVSAVLQAWPSAAKAVHLPASAKVHVPPAEQTAMLVATTLFAPHWPPDAARVSAMHLRFAVLQPTW
jgi:hypothetical protein